MKKTQEFDPMALDIELSAHDLQGLNNADAVAAFFARLGYNTELRTEQTPANLGITAEGTVRPLKRIELIADHENLFQVFLFELTSVTVSHTRALARTFRNRAGNYLLVLTSDYERIDFVLIEKYVPEALKAISTIGQKQVGVWPRPLTIDRRKPDRVHLRVLRRLTWTESDPIAQYDKLRSAYDVADWSEEFFNNRALFSDYYLKERLPTFEVWKEDPKPSYLLLCKLYQGAAGRFAGEEEGFLRRELMEPVLGTLGFKARIGKKADSSAEEPDYRLYSKEGKTDPIALCLVYPWGRSLDGKDDQRDKETPDENPGAVVVSLLEKGEVPWVVVTNGKLWRLYARRAHSRATNYYEIDLEEVLAQSGPHAAGPAEAFRYFWLLFRCQAFESITVIREGKEEYLPFLDRLLLESEDYAKKLGERLKERVFEQIFPHLAAGFIAYIRQRDGLQADLSQEALDAVFQATLTFLYRLLFLLYAESRDLLPVKEERGYFGASLTRLKREIGDVAGSITDEAEKRLNKHYREDQYELYDRLARLFRVVDEGDHALNVPVYNGGLFLSDPAEDDESPEAEVARFLNAAKVADRFLARALDLLARDVDEKRHDLVFIDYKSLGVRQLGSIYEGLLEFKLRVAPEKMAVVKGKKTEEVILYTDAKREKRKVLKQRRGKEAKERVIAKGSVYLENDKHERKATGSYYTPDHIVKYIVEHAVGPVVREKFEAMRPKLRAAQKWHRDMIKLAEAKRELVSKYEFGPAVNNKWGWLVDELFDLKILDPAMGSGHFLVEAVDFITDKAIDFLNAFPWNPVIAHLTEMRETILQEMDEQGITIDAKRLTDVNLLKRHVLKRCTYGVDLNPMAVELAKVSLWLDCFTLGAPLSFLDHHLRCGNSLIGLTVEEVREAIEWKRGETGDLFGSRFAGLLLATDLMRHVGELSDITSAQVQESRAKYRKASGALAPFKRILDVYTSQWFGNGVQKKARGKRKGSTDPPAVKFLKTPEAEAFINARDDAALRKALDAMRPEDRQIAERALTVAEEKRIFHWELEFPEVFYGPRPGTRQVIEQLEGAGFDAVIGNPPYDVLASKELGYDVSQDLAFYKSRAEYETAIRGKKNLYKLFICRGAALIAATGTFSFIVPMALLGDDQSAGVRRHLLEETGLVSIEAFPQKDEPHNRVFPEAKLSTAIFVTHAKPVEHHFAVRTHPGRLIEGLSPTLHIAPQQIINFDSGNVPIVTCTQRDWEIATKITGHAKIERIGDYCRAYQGEVNETTDGKKRFISTDVKEGPQILRGSTICLYVIREPSQGEAIYLRKQRYLNGKRNSEKARHHKQRRVGWQESSPQNNFRRIIAASVPKGEFCNHKINYIPESESQISLDLVLALLNSRLSDWFFRLASTNAAVSHYQIYNLPAPRIVVDESPPKWQELIGRGKWSDLSEVLCEACAEPGVMPESVADALAAMSQYIQEIEARRVLKGRSDRSHLAPESQSIQDAIDAVLFRCYGLSVGDRRYIEKRLEEML